MKATQKQKRKLRQERAKNNRLKSVPRKAGKP